MDKEALKLYIGYIKSEQPYNGWNIKTSVCMNDQLSDECLIDKNLWKNSEIHLRFEYDRKVYNIHIGMLFFEESWENEFSYHFTDNDGVLFDISFNSINGNEVDKDSICIRVWNKENDYNEGFDCDDIINNRFVQLT